jgi:non-heme chloroperoxidase
LPGLVIYGGDDQVGPFSLAGQVSTAIIKGSAVKVYSGAPDGITGQAQAAALRRPARLNA